MSLDLFVCDDLSINHLCPFCNASVPQIQDTFRVLGCYFNAGRPHHVDNSALNTSIINLNMLYCPTCKKVSFVAIGENGLDGLNIPLYPSSLAKQFPEYIPKAIREDYEEAYSILNLSPKASATLARRCLQGMIRDFWGITKSRLIDEINELQSKVTPSQWKAIDSVRSIGNIGAHMEKQVDLIIDVEPNEAQKLLKLIELLIDKWYISRHDEEHLLLDIQNIVNDKKSQR